MRDGRLLRGTRLRVRSTLLVKDSGELIEGILSATTERRDILRRILLMRRYPARWLLCTSPLTGINGRRETFYNQAYLFVKRVRNKDGLLDIKLDVLFFFGF